MIPDSLNIVWQTPILGEIRDALETFGTFWIENLVEARGRLEEAATNQTGKFSCSHRNILIFTKKMSVAFIAKCYTTLRNDV